MLLSHLALARSLSISELCKISANRKHEQIGSGLFILIRYRHIYLFCIASSCANARYQSTKSTPSTSSCISYCNHCTCRGIFWTRLSQEAMRTSAPRSTDIYAHLNRVWYQDQPGIGIRTRVLFQRQIFLFLFHAHLRAEQRDRIEVSELLMRCSKWTFFNYNEEELEVGACRSMGDL